MLENIKSKTDNSNPDAISFDKPSTDQDNKDDITPLPKETDINRFHVFKFTRPVFQFILMVAVLFSSYMLMEKLIASREKPQKKPTQQISFTVETLDAKRGDHRPDVLVYGHVETARSIELRPLVNGEIINVNPDLSAGTPIEKGALLIEIDRFNYEGAIVEAKANLVQSESKIRETNARLALEDEQLSASQEQLELSRADLERAQSLARSGTLTNKQVEDRTLIVSQRAQSVSQRRNNILIAQAQKEQQLANTKRLRWKLREAERRLENTRLFAPFSGVISSINAEPGRSVSTNDVIAAIYDDEALEVRFTLTNTQYGRMVMDSDPLFGRQIKILWAIGSTDYTYRGIIDRISAKVAAEKGGVEVVALITPEDHAVQLRPGAFVDIIVPDRVYHNAIKVPETAIYQQSHIFLVKDNQLVQHNIDVLAFSSNNAIIKGKDNENYLIKNGDKILITRLTEAESGVNVRIKNQVN